MVNRHCHPFFVLPKSHRYQTDKDMFQVRYNLQRMLKSTEDDHEEKRNYSQRYIDPKTKST